VEELVHWWQDQFRNKKWEKLHDFGSNCRPITFGFGVFLGFPKGNIDTNVLN
jgi:hypothetical protein